jgi:hypothetical protein
VKLVASKKHPFIIEYWPNAYPLGYGDLYYRFGYDRIEDGVITTKA